MTRRALVQGGRSANALSGRRSWLAGVRSFEVVHSMDIAGAPRDVIVALVDSDIYPETVVVNANGQMVLSGCDLYGAPASILSSM